MTGRDDAGVTQMGNSGVGRDWCIAGMRERGRRSFSVHVEVREVEISIERIAVVGEVGGGLRINGKGGRRRKLQAGGGEKVSFGYSWEGRNQEMGKWKRSTGKTQEGEGMLEGKEAAGGRGGTAGCGLRTVIRGVNGIRGSWQRSGEEESRWWQDRRGSSGRRSE